jgi:hypothetical protein
MHKEGNQERNFAFLLFGLLLACYLFTYTGLIDSSDGLAIFSTTDSLVRRGQVDSNQLLWMGLQQGSFGPDGELYSRKGVGLTLLLLPLVWLAHLWPTLGLVQSALLLNPLLTAHTAVLIYRAGRRLAWSPAAALASGLIFGLASMAWPYTQGLFSDPACGWGLLGSVYGLLAHQQSGRKRYLLGSGLAWAVAYLTRPINLMTLPIFLLGLLFVFRSCQPAGDQTGSGAAAFVAALQRHWRPLITFLIPVVGAGLVSLWWNWVRYGNIWESGYVESETFSAPWGEGLYGLLLGPARGLFWYNPVLLLAFLGIGWFWRHTRVLFAILLTIGLFYVLVYSKWYMWHGGYSWGPRFLVPLLPFLALLCGPAWAHWVERPGAGWPGRFAFFLLVGCSVAVQWLGLFIPFSLVQEWLATQYQPLFAAETFTQLGLSPLLLQWRYLTSEHIHLAWWRSGAVDWSALVAPLASILLGLVLLARTWRTGEARDESKGRPINWFYGLFLGVIALALLAHYESTLVPLPQREQSKHIEALEQPGDAILFLQPEQTQHFANVYHGSLPIYGLPPRGSLNKEDEAWLARLVRQHQRLWVAPDSALPEESGWERALRTEHYLLWETKEPEANQNRLALYALAAAQPLVESGLGTIFGDPMRADQTVTETNGWIRLNGYALTPRSKPGGALLLSLQWQSLQQVDQNYHVFVHLLNERKEKVAQRDGQPVQWLRPTSSWRPGEEIRDPYGLLLPLEIAAGNYTIAVGLYDPVNGQRLPISAGPGTLAIELGPVMIER